MSDSSSTPSPRYSPPPELLQQAEALLRSASSSEMQCASLAYRAYGLVTGHRSAVTGAELPRFDDSPLLVRAGWLSVVRHSSRGFFEHFHAGPAAEMEGADGGEELRGV